MTLTIIIYLALGILTACIERFKLGPGSLIDWIVTIIIWPGILIAILVKFGDEVKF